MGLLTGVPEKLYSFLYDDEYLKWDSAVSVGPELPLTSREHVSVDLFPSFRDRIPDRSNPAYREYCEIAGIDLEENDDFVRITTIGRKGPSIFIFEPYFRNTFSGREVERFRKTLKLSLRNFGRLFDCSPYTLQKIESGRLPGSSVLKRLELYVLFNEAAMFEAKRNKAKVHSRVWHLFLKKISELSHTAGSASMNSSSSDTTS